METQTQNQPQVTEQQQDAAERNELLEGLKNLKNLDDQTDGLRPEEKQQAADDTAEGDEAPEAEVEDSDSAEDSEDEPDQGGEPAPEEKENPDPEVARKIEAIQREESRVAQMRAELKAEQEAIARQREEFGPALEEFRSLKARAAHDPAGVLSALGVDLAEMGEIAARQIYSMSNAAASDPKTRAQAQEALRAREMVSRLDALENRNKELEAQLQQQLSQVKAEQQAKEYMSGFRSAIDADEAPLVSRKFSNSPDEANALLEDVAYRLYSEHGEIPNHADVVSVLESQLKKELNSLGIDPESILKSRKKAAAAEKQPAKSLSSKELSTPTTPRTAPKTEEELDAEILEGLRKMRT